MNDLVFRTATELADFIRKRNISAQEVVRAHLDQIEKHNPRLNAVVTVDAEGALQRAAEADRALARGELWGPLHGVPVTIKDAFETKGLRTTSSYRPLSNYLPDEDAPVVARLRAAGAVILGKTNMPELAMDFQSNSPLFGPARNPWDLQRTPGGSTGGGAAAVAAGLSPLEIGSDLGGSIRIPSHFCGVFGYKPTEHLVPSTGHIPEIPGQIRAVRHMEVCGPIARSIEDLIKVLPLLAGPDGKDWEVPPLPLHPEAVPPFQGLRIAWTDDFGGVPVCREARDALAELAERLSAAGCRVERGSPESFAFEDAWETYGRIVGAEMGFNFPAGRRTASRLFGQVLFRRVPLYRAIIRGVTLQLGRYLAALARRDALISALDRFLACRDAWLCPVSATPAFTHRASGTTKVVEPLEVDGKRVEYYTANMSYTTPFNLTGNPVVVLPLTRSEQGLPIGVQVVGRRWRDMRLLAVATRLTELTGPYERPPGF